MRDEVIFLMIIGVIVVSVACSVSYIDHNKTQIEIAKIQAGCKP